MLLRPPKRGEALPAPISPMRALWLAYAIQAPLLAVVLLLADPSTDSMPRGVAILGAFVVVALAGLIWTRRRAARTVPDAAADEAQALVWYRMRSLHGLAFVEPIVFGAFAGALYGGGILVYLLGLLVWVWPVWSMAPTTTDVAQAAAQVRAAGSTVQLESLLFRDRGAGTGGVDGSMPGGTAP